jgi:dCTP deaminase
MFLTDRQLHELLDPPSKVIDGLVRDQVTDSKADQIQPASVDLTIGGIYVPDSDEGKRGSAGHPIDDELSLDSGKTAVVETQETCHLPADIGAIGFPPTSVSAGGLLMTNPGHVDPGYQGKLSFTVINMAKEPYALKRGSDIVTLLIFRLPEKARAPYDKRNPGEHGAVTDGRLNKLDYEFLDVSEKAKRAAKEAERTTRAWGLGVPIVVGLLTLFGVVITSSHAHDKDISNLQRDVKVLQEDVKVERFIAQLEAERNHNLQVTLNLGRRGRHEGRR